MLEALVGWLTTTSAGNFFADRIWSIALSQTIHILAVSTVMVPVVLLNLRLLGVVGTSRPFAAMFGDFRPWIWWAMLALLVTGLIQTIAEPGRELLSSAYQMKVALLFLVVGITYYYQRTLRTNPGYWDAPSRRSLAVALALLSLFFWIGIVVMGRLVAYMGQDSNLF